MRLRPRLPKRRTTVGASPGTIVVDPGAVPTRVSVTAFAEASVTELPFGRADDLAAALRDPRVVWVRVQGLGDRELLHGIAEQVGMHPLALEDVVHTHQRLKVEPYGSDLFLVGRANDVRKLGATRQVSLLIRRGLVVSFEEAAGPLFEPVLGRITRGVGRIRQLGADYLGYALIDSVVDSFFPAVELAADRLDVLERATMEDAQPAVMARIYELKRDLSMLHRVVWPHRDMLNQIARADFEVVEPATVVFFRDCLDHATQVIDHLAQLRDICVGLMELHASLTANRMNDVMRTLTVIATIFIPLTFVVGLYGMNFDPDASPWNMPELRWRYGYPAVLVVVAVIGLGLYLWFRRQGWMRARRRP